MQITAPADTHEGRIQSLPVGLKRLWIGVLVAPSAWLLMEFVGYYLASRSCEERAGGVPLLGTAHPSVTQIILSLVFLIAAVAGLTTALGNWRALQPPPDRHTSPEWGRAHFLAVAGVIGSVLFIGGIVLFGLPAFFVNACSQAR